MKKILKNLDGEALVTSFMVLVVLGAGLSFLLQVAIGKETWRENYTQTLDNIYVRADTRKDTYKVTVESVAKEKKKGSFYTISFNRMTDNYVSKNYLTRTFSEDEYKTFIGEGCNRLETDTYVLSLIIPSIQRGDIFEVIVLRTAEFGEDKFSDEEIRKIAEAFLEEMKKEDSPRKYLGSCEAKLLEPLGIKCTKESVSAHNKGLFVKAEDYWSSLEEEGYKKLLDK